MQYSLFVNSSPLTRSSSLSAFRFSQAAIELGHTIHLIFFYQEGVMNGFLRPEAPLDELAFKLKWDTLMTAESSFLICCSASAARRGLTQETLAPGFSLGGLGQFFESINQTDRTLIFN